MGARQGIHLMERRRSLDYRGDDHGDPVFKVETRGDQSGMLDLGVAKTGLTKGKQIVCRYLARRKRELHSVCEEGPFPGR